MFCGFFYFVLNQQLVLRDARLVPQRRVEGRRNVTTLNSFFVKKKKKEKEKLSHIKQHGIGTDVRLREKEENENTGGLRRFLMGFSANKKVGFQGIAVLFKRIL